MGILGPVKVVVHDRTGELPAPLRAYAERKLERLGRHLDLVVEAEAEFDRERRKSQTPAHTVQLIVRTDGRRHPLAQALELAAEPRAAFDLALDKIDRQVVKLKEKIKSARKRGGSAPAPVAAAAAAPEGPERVRVHLRPETMAAAERELDLNGHQFRVYLDEDTGEIGVLYRKADGSVAVIEPVIS